ncbi:MAG TPA: helix-turn-helix domain-containing protein [Phycisphaerae bacterium]|nr:helix-turn-helix domain-containing protein [Phycisphaerae bacterium]
MKMGTDTAATPAPTVPALALRAPEAAKALGISERTLWALTAANEVPHVRLGRTVLYPTADLTRWLTAQATGGEARK